MPQHSSVAGGLKLVCETLLGCRLRRHGNHLLWKESLCLSVFSVVFAVSVCLLCAVADHVPEQDLLWCALLTGFVCWFLLHHGCAAMAETVLPQICIHAP